jgi:hypothetical protein
MTDPFFLRPDRPRPGSPATIAVAIVAFSCGLLLGNLPRLVNLGPPIVAAAIVQILILWALTRRFGKGRCPGCGLAAGRPSKDDRADPWSGPPDLADGEILSPSHAELVKGKRLRTPGSPNGPGLVR